MVNACSIRVRGTNLNYNVMDHWDTLIRVKDSETCSTEIKEMATMLLGQLNTASGSRIKPEIESFIYTNNLENYANI